MKLKLIIILFLPFVLFGSDFKSYPRQLENPIQKLLSFPPAQELLDEVQKQGAVRVNYKPFSLASSKALWNCSKREIVINSNASFSEGRIIRSLVFELHNALNDKKFAQLDYLAQKRAISKEEYVKRIEFIEYQHTLQSATLISSAINLGYYPSSSYLSIWKDFQSHYQAQKRCGHSQIYADIYDRLA